MSKAVNRHKLDGEWQENDLSREIIGAAIEVHRELGGGVLESIYEEALCHELNLRALRFVRRPSVTIRYKGVEFVTDLDLHLLVEGKVAVSLMCSESVPAVEKKKALSHLRLLSIHIGLIINFRTRMIRDGVVRLINDVVEQEVFTNVTTSLSPARTSRGDEGLENFRGVVDENALTGTIIGASIEVHRELGPGLRENIYEAALCRELDLRGFRYLRQPPVIIGYKGVKLSANLRADLIVENRMVIDLKAKEQVLPIDKTKLLTYLRLLKLHLGLIINFRVEILADGVHRIINNFSEAAPSRHEIPDLQT